MKNLITIATLVFSSSVLAQFNASTYDWNNDANELKVNPTSVVTPLGVNPKGQRVVYKSKDNGIFGYNPYNMMDPRWMMEEMSNIID